MIQKQSKQVLAILEIKCRPKWRPQEIHKAQNIYINQRLHRDNYRKR